MSNTISNIRENCTACRACEKICSYKAITMIENKEGFLYPIVDYKLCVNCGACKNVCHCLKNIENKKNNYEIFAVKPLEKQVARKSTSGGIAWLLSKYVLEEKGVVFGAAYVDGFNVEHIKVDNEIDLQKLRGSKYVISDTKNTFEMVRKEIINRKVLYIGTACQISALKSYLKKDYENLITIDIVCHGVPSLKLFKKYIGYIEKKYGKKIVKYDFRNKEMSDWGMGFTAKVEFDDGSKKYLKADFDPYYINFLKGNTYRESCYKCKYADINIRPADITIADFWGIEKFKPNFYDKNGVSMCIINTDMGKEIFENIKEKIVYEKATDDEAIYFNGNLTKPTLRPDIRNSIYDGIEESEYVEKIKPNKSIKVIIKNILPKFVWKIYKKYIKSNN